MAPRKKIARNAKIVLTEKLVAQKLSDLAAGLRSGTIIPVDKSKIFSR